MGARKRLAADKRKEEKKTTIFCCFKKLPDFTEENEARSRFGSRYGG
jgi:hypothetical protein